MALSQGCGKALKTHLGVDQIALTGVTSVPNATPPQYVHGNGKILNVDCKVQAAIYQQSGQSLFVLAAQSRTTDWTFGTCFPEMPGSWTKKADNNNSGTFFLRWLTLNQPTWIFVYASVLEDAKGTPVTTKQAKTKFANLLTGLQQKTSLKQQLAQMLGGKKLSEVVKPMNGLTMLGSLPSLPNGLKPVHDFLGKVTQQPCRSRTRSRHSRSAVSPADVGSQAERSIGETDGDGAHLEEPAS